MENQEQQNIFPKEIMSEKSEETSKPELTSKAPFQIKLISFLLFLNGLIILIELFFYVAYTLISFFILGFSIIFFAYVLWGLLLSTLSIITSVGLSRMKAWGTKILFITTAVHVLAFAFVFVVFFRNTTLHILENPFIIQPILLILISIYVFLKRNTLKNQETQNKILEPKRWEKIRLKS